MNRDNEMMDIKDMQHQPNIEECIAYIQLPVFQQLLKHMKDEYKALVKIEYSKDTWYKGWNIKFRKAGKSLCVVYPRVGYFIILIVVSKKEKEIVEQKLPTFSKKLQEIYYNTKEGMGQRWLMIEIHDQDIAYPDVLELIQIRRSIT